MISVLNYDEVYLIHLMPGDVIDISRENVNLKRELNPGPLVLLD